MFNSGLEGLLILAVTQFADLIARRLPKTHRPLRDMDTGELVGDGCLR